MEAGPAAGNSRRSPKCHRRCNSAARREARQQLRLRGRFVCGRRELPVHWLRPGTRESVVPGHIAPSGKPTVASCRPLADGVARVARGLRISSAPGGAPQVVTRT